MNYRSTVVRKMWPERTVRQLKREDGNRCCGCLPNRHITPVINLSHQGNSKPLSQGVAEQWACYPILANEI